MRLTRDQKIRLGLFYLVGGVLTVGIFALVIGDLLLQTRDTYYVELVSQPVSGLQTGSSVLYQGINVGRVEDIRFDPEEPRRVTIVLSLQEGTPIKDDVEAQLTMTGITGARQIELIGGGRSAALLPPGSHISSGTSLFDNITGDAQVIIAKVEQTLNNINQLLGPDNRQRVSNILTGVDDLIVANREPLTASLERLDAITGNVQILAEHAAAISRRIDENTSGEDFEQAVASIYVGANNLQLITEQIKAITSSSEWEDILSNTTLTAERTAAIAQDASALAASFSEIPLAEIAGDVALLLEQFSATFNRMDMTIIRSSRDVLRSMEILNEILEDLSDFSRIISQDPSSLIRF
ncbi:MlaD family protein [Spirochaeta dissipatitropha]